MSINTKGFYRIEKIEENNYGVYFKDTLMISGISSEKLATECLTSIMIPITLSYIKQNSSLENVLKNAKLTEQ